MQRFSAFRCSVVFAALGLTGWLAAQAMASGLTFDIAAGSATTTLKQFASQAHVQLLFDYKAVENLKTPAVKGQLTPIEALKEMLEGSGFTFREINDHTIAVMAPGTSTSSTGTQDPTSTEPAKEGKKDSSGAFRVAQVDQGRTPSDNPVEKPDEQTSEKRKSEQLQVVIVTGSRIPTAAGQEALPVRSYTREDIERTSQGTLGDFLNVLPDVSTFMNTSQTTGIAGIQTVQLHGLPVGTVLTLLDGRRLETSTLGFFDLSSIPLAAVERVEILPVGASAVYGADALAGAVNTVLRKDFQGFEIDASLDRAPGVNDPTVNAAWGTHWTSGSLSLISTFQARGALLGSERKPTSLTQFPAGIPASAIATLESDQCVPGNVYSVDGSNLPGLSAPEAGIPAGVTGRPTIGQFSATTGLLNVCNAERYRDFTPESRREALLVTAHQELTDVLELFTETLLAHGHLRDQFGPTLQVTQSFGGTVAASNPYNPFGVPVNVSFAYPGAGQNEEQSSSLVRPLVGVRGKFASDWYYEATAYWSRDQLHDVDLFTDFQKTINALNSPDPATAINPFASGAPANAQLLSSLTDPYLDASGTLYDDRLIGGQGILRGSPLRLPSGAIESVLGAEYGQERHDTRYDGGFNVGIPPLLLSRHTYAIFSEARAPLLGQGDAGVKGTGLALALAARYDHSSDFGGKTTWQSGLSWRMIPSLNLNANYGQSYRAPRLDEIGGPLSMISAPLGAPDPFRGNQPILYPVDIVFGPNFHLKPETGDSFTLGLQYTADHPGFRAALNWYAINIANFIGLQQFEAILQNPDIFPGAVVRAPPSAADQQQGFLGPIIQFNDTFFNFGDLHVKGFDADLRYSLDTRIGAFTPSLAVANIYKWTSALAPQLPPVDGVSRATLRGVGWAPRWKGTAALSWQRGPLAIHLSGRYIGRYLDYQDLVANSNEIGNSWIFDMHARWDVPAALVGRASWLTGSYIALGVVDLLNRTPPFSYNPNWYDTQQYDLRGRFIRLTAGLQF